MTIVFRNSKGQVQAHRFDRAVGVQERDPKTGRITTRRPTRGERYRLAWLALTTWGEE